MTATIKTEDGYIFKFSQMWMTRPVYTGTLLLPDGNTIDGGHYSRQHVARAVKSAREHGWTVNIK